MFYVYKLFIHQIIIEHFLLKQDILVSSLDIFISSLSKKCLKKKKKNECENTSRLEIQYQYESFPGHSCVRVRDSLGLQSFGR